MSLDTLDTKILAIVQRNCRVQAEDIADQVGLSASAVQRRLKRLRTEGVIMTEVAVVDQNSVSRPLTLIAGIEIERDNYRVLSQFKTWAEQRDDIQQVYYVTGNADLIVVITAASMASYDALTEQLMTDIPQVRRITTNVVLNDLKKTLYVPLDDAVCA